MTAEKLQSKGGEENLLDIKDKHMYICIYIHVSVCKCTHIFSLQTSQH